MKERIRELAIEADIMAPTWNHVPLGHQKFAEMIVRECAELARKKNYQLMNEGMPFGVTSTELLNHFGVKE
jgi:hypothetical protein